MLINDPSEIKNKIKDENQIHKLKILYKKKRNTNGI